MASHRARRRAIKRAAVLVRERLPFLARKPDPAVLLLGEQARDMGTLIGIAHAQHEVFSGAFRSGGVRREG